MPTAASRVNDSPSLLFRCAFSVSCCSLPCPQNGSGSTHSSPEDTAPRDTEGDAGLSPGPWPASSRALLLGQHAGSQPSRTAPWSPVSLDPHGHCRSPHCSFPSWSDVDGLLHRHARASVSGSPYQCVLGIQSLTEWMEDPLPATNELSGGWNWGHRLIIRRRRIYSAFGVTLPRPAPLFFIRDPCCPG